MEDIVRATEHDMYIPDIDGEKVYKAVEEGVAHFTRKLKTAWFPVTRRSNRGAVSRFRRFPTR